MATAMEMEIAMTTITVASIIAPTAPMVTLPFVADYQFLKDMVTDMVTVMVMAMGAVLTATVDMEATAAVHTMAATVAILTMEATVVDTVATVVVTVATATAAAGDLEGHRPTTFT